MPNCVAMSTISSMSESREPSMRSSVSRSATRRCAQSWAMAGSSLARSGKSTS